MTGSMGYSLSLAWLSVVALMAAVDFGLAAGRVSEFVDGFPANGISTAELLLFMAVLYGLYNKHAWGWVLVAAWIPVWIAYSSWELYQDGEALLAWLWAPIFLGSAIAHRFLMRDEVRGAFGLSGRFWSVARWISLPAFGCALFVPLRNSFDSQIAGALCLWLLIVVTTAPRVYGWGSAGRTHR